LKRGEHAIKGEKGFQKKDKINNPVLGSNEHHIKSDKSKSQKKKKGGIVCPGVGSNEPTFFFPLPSESVLAPTHFLR